MGRGKLGRPKNRVYGSGTTHPVLDLGPEMTRMEDSHPVSGLRPDSGTPHPQSTLHPTSLGEDVGHSLFSPSLCRPGCDRGHSFWSSKTTGNLIPVRDPDP